MHRSGTSAFARSVVELGANPGNNLMPETEDNPKGYWEDQDVVNLNEQILKSFNMSWHSLDNPIINRFETLLHLYEEKFIKNAIDILENNFTLSNTIVIKDPRISVLLPFWKNVFQRVGAEVKYVLAVRNPLETSKSLLKRNQMEMEQGIKLWTYYNFMLLKSVKEKVLISSFDSLLVNPIQELERIGHHIGLLKGKNDLKEFSGTFLEASLKHYNDEVETLSEYVGEKHVSVEMYEYLNAWSNEGVISTFELDSFVEKNLDKVTRFLGYDNNEYIDDYAQLFINTGEGYFEEKSYKQKLTSFTNVVEFDIEKEIPVVEFRFDPSKSGGIILINSISLEGDKGSVEYHIQSGNFQYQYKNLFIFQSEDPQFIIKPVDSVSKLKIEYSKSFVDFYTYAFLTTLKSNKYNEMQNLLIMKDQELSEKVTVIAAKNEEIKQKNQIVNAQETKINEKNQLLAENEKVINSKLEELNNIAQQLEVLTLEVKEKKEITKKYEEAIETNNKELHEMSFVLENKTKQIETLESQIQKNNETLKQQEEVIDTRSRELSDKDREINEKLQFISLKEKEIQDKIVALQEKEEIISYKNQEIEKHNQTIHSLLNEIQVKNEYINKKEENRIDLEQQVTTKNQEISSLNIQLHSTQSKINDFLDLLNRVEAQKVNLFFGSILRFLKMILKFFVHPISTIKLLDQKNLLKKSNLFNKSYYRYSNQDLILADIDLLEHFILHGWKEGRSPNPHFNMELHLQNHPAFLTEDKNPIISMIMNERDMYNKIRNSKLFIEQYYLANNEDVAAKKVDPVMHYIEYGFKEGRNPSKDFNTNFYLTAYKDIAEAGVNPLWHYIKYGQYEGRLPYEGFTRDLNPYETFVFNIKKLRQFKKNANINFRDVLKYINEKGYKELIRNVRFVITGSHGPLKRHTIQYTYEEPELDEKIKAELDTFKLMPKISVIMPVYNVEPKWLELAIKSVELQWYTNWEICIVDDRSTNPSTIDYLKNVKNERIKVHFLTENLNISGASNEALKMTTGDYILLMDNDDEITPDAMYEVVKEINNSGAEFIYSDEDKFELDGSFSSPHFKPDYSPDLIISQNYMSHIGVIKKSLIEKVGGFTIGLEGAQDHDLYLRVLEHTNQVIHIPKVLYHWRKIPGSTASEFSDKSYAQEAGRISVENAIKRRNLRANVLNGKFPGTFRVKYEIKDNPLVSIVIPFKDMPELLTQCIESILSKSTYKNYEIIGISNNSEQKDTFEEMKRLTSLDQRINFVEYNVPFNYSKINNYAVNEFAKGEHIIFLNNDIEILTGDWIESMLGFSQRENVGAVGAKLYFPNDTIQHAGIIIGIGGVAGHSHKYFPKDIPGYFSRLFLDQNLSAVTAACLMVKKSIFDKVNGFNEEDLKVAFNDVDLCLRIKELGYYNVFTPYAEAYHHESISRGQEDNPEKIKRFQSEIDYMQKRHSRILAEGDPYYNINLTLEHEDFSLKV